ncbi:hypothetical protein K4K59_012265 [Colletotrichum sp. SAR11_240]|nr:hypothetical protein K4K59_012265 [Colletotrichum sp. SAR11_240]
MDPGTALAVVGLSLQVLGGVKEYYKSWKDCDDDVRQFREALQRLETVLGHLQTTLKKPDLDATITSTICDACHNMEDEMDEVKAILRKFKKDGSPSTMMQKLRQMGRRACYPFRKSTISRFMEIIEDLNDNLGLAIGVLSFVAMVDHKIDDMQRVAEEMKIWEWLKAPDYMAAHDQATSLHKPGTGSWFADGAEFKKWNSERQSRLWVHGGVGVGKTVLW